MTSLPTWAVYLVSIGTPVLAFLGGSLGQLISRRADNRLDRWRRREETMRMLRWASEQAADAESLRSRVGIAALRSLKESELLQDADKHLLSAVTAVVVFEPLSTYPDEGEDVEFIVETEGD